MDRIAIDPIQQAKAARRINCGCGEHPLLYWTNIDSDPSLAADLHAELPPLPYGDSSLDEIWACHFLEHLEPLRADEFLRECYRCLTPGGVLGMVVPDMREVLTRYVNRTNDAVEWPAGTWWSVRDMDALCAVFLYSSIQPSPHRWSYDSDTLARALCRVGFVHLTEIDRYRDPRIAQGAWYQCGWDCYKPKGTE